MRCFLALILLMLQHFILTTEFWYSILQKGLLSNAVCRFEFSYLMFPTVYKSFQISSFSCERLQYKSLVVCLQWLHCGSFHSHLLWQMQMIMQCFPVSFMYFCRRLMTKFKLINCLYSPSLENADFAKKCARTYKTQTHIIQIY